MPNRCPILTSHMPYPASLLLVFPAIFGADMTYDANNHTSAFAALGLRLRRVCSCATRDAQYSRGGGCYGAAMAYGTAWRYEMRSTDVAYGATNQ
eukprot:864578-Rhodomonas_salina.1